MCVCVCVCVHVDACVHMCVCMHCVSVYTCIGGSVSALCVHFNGFLVLVALLAL